MTAQLTRHKRTDKATNGLMVVSDATGKPVLRLQTVELPWKDNEPNVSCIPDGRYKCERINHPKFGICFAVRDVPKREGILIHAANFSKQLKGCIAPGLTTADIDGDGVMDVTSSKAAMQQLTDTIKSQYFTLTITSL